ncbi:S8 family serine peptidase [Shewanella donghaensis]|uniref:S8 family serine peptidase n=1 Tax=Shewanella donghaensis TaxID=238836 RepID=UPI001182D72D|nr:S8 family serine peptidase [Shewanella donghaensis]
MTSIYKKSLIAAALTLAFAPSINANVVDTRGLDTDGNHRSNPTTATTRNIENLYMVLLDDQPLATYHGGVENLAATSLLSNPTNTRKGNSVLNVKSATSQHYIQYLKSQRQQTLAQAKSRLNRQLYIKNEYQIALNGFSTELSEKEAQTLASIPGIKRVDKVELRHLNTDSGPKHIQAPSAWDGTATGVSSMGEGVTVAIMDTGINAFHPSFADVGADGYDHINPLGEGVYAGDCASSELAHYCNDKLIGIWGHPDLLADYTPEGDDLIAIDHNGHGSHVASTTAGNVVKDVPVFNAVGEEAEFTLGEISGVAPHANIISYQVCVADGSCWTDITALAVEHAIEHGVQAINYSIGGGASDPWGDSDALAFLAAREAGIHVAVAAGNDGPGAETVGSPGNAPWLTTVAAYTHDRNFTDKDVTFTGGDYDLAALTGKGATSGISGEIVFAGDFDNSGCLEPFAADTFSGQIVVCERGDIARVSKGTNVLAGGASGLVLINVTSADETVDADLHVLPTIHLDIEQGKLLTDWLASGTGHSATIGASVMESDPAKADIAASFTSRGPESIMNRWLTPHIAAPGVAIYAANTEYQPWHEDANKNESPFTFMDGTSMATPHITGAYALIAALKPEWSPAQAQSALMLSAETDTLLEDGVTPSDFFVAGAGSARIKAALNAGLVMDMSYDDYINADPRLEGEPEEMNLASALKNECMMECNWTRTFTATAASTWTVTGSSDTTGMSISGTPSSFTLAAGESITLDVTASIGNGYASEYGMGHLVLTPNNNSLTPSKLPIIGSFVAGSFPENVMLLTAKDNSSAEISGITTVGSSDLQVGVFELAEIEVIETTIPRDDSDTSNWPTNVYNDSTKYYSQLINVTPNTKRIVARVKHTSSPDLDLYIGRDSNYNGQPDNALEFDELICMSATETAYESCEVNDPAPGSYYVTVHNFGDTSAPSDVEDEMVLELAIIGKDDGSVTVDYKSEVGSNEDIGLVLNWNKPLKPDTFYTTVLEIGTGVDVKDNIGLMPVELYRYATFAQSSLDVETADTGDIVTLSIALADNNSDSERTIDVSATVPTGLTVNSDSHQGTTEADTISWQVVQAPNEVGQVIMVAFDTQTLVMSQELQFDVTHIVDSIGFDESLAPVMLEGIPVAMINGAVSVALTADESTSVTLAATGSTAPNSDDVLTYAWTHVSGPAVTFADATAMETQVNLPAVDTDGTAVIELVVSNGQKTAVAAVANIAIKAEVIAPTPDPDTGSDSSGGSMGGFMLLAGLLGLRRRFK